MKHLVQIRRASMADWTSTNPTLALGEIALTTDTRQIKIGDGSTPWNDMKFVAFDGGCLDCSSSSSSISSSSSSSLNTTPPPATSSSSSSSSLYYCDDNLGCTAINSPNEAPLGKTVYQTLQICLQNCNSCPAPWMKILMADGTLVEAGKIRKGDKVHTRNEDTMEWGDYEVTVAQTVMSERIRLVLDNTEFVCSPSHKFRDGNGWITADQLRKGQRLEGLEIKDVSEETYGEVVKLTVDKAHTYVCEGLLSHNKSELPPPPAPSPGSSSSSSSQCATTMCFYDNSNCGEPNSLLGSNQGTCPGSYDTIGPGGPCRVEVYPLSCTDFKCTYQFNNASKTWTPAPAGGLYKDNQNNYWSTQNCTCNCPSDPGLPQGAPDELAQINISCLCS